MTRRPENLYAQYHAHVYFGPDTADQARKLREAAGEQLPASIGRFHEKPVGPHPHWSFQMAFDAAMFDQVIAWLEAHRDGLDVLVHGLTGDDYADHTAHAMWLGNSAVLDLSRFTPGASS
ncbi:DOPA 4,5-dioxygenase family protein [Variovorax sp. J22R133]|uniref:DOPA 4,5-dioxygenase family protein n=1 Tax=Variovorax brevis TaxID=3053503 RepID=UPI002577CE88|nr:DOPA 4,5-dioxygenase family protein [Variovorax sp. J22R133]MDM0113454.1 DOPA 4,5-dioxygenase family protein [Variovorax sp. J22R133]